MSKTPHYYRRTSADGTVGLMKSSGPMPPAVLAVWGRGEPVDTLDADEYARASRAQTRRDDAEVRADQIEAWKAKRQIPPYDS